MLKLAMLAVLLTPAPLQATAESVEEYARRNQGHFYQGFYQQHRKTGWFHVHRYIGNCGGKKLAISVGKRILYEKVKGKCDYLTLTIQKSG